MTRNRGLRPIPSGTRLQADPSLRRRQHGRLLIGGSPLRFVKVSEAGADVVSRWLAGEAVTSGASANKLARRLLDAGMVHPRPGPPPVSMGDGQAETARSSAVPPTTLSILIPVKDDLEGLQATLHDLRGVIERHDVIVVDDGSRVAVDPADLDSNVTVLRRATAGGPGVARQHGLAHLVTPLVAFIDAGVRLEAEVLDRLCAWFNDPDLLAVGPRVACVAGNDVLSVYEQARSPLDLGTTPALVGGDSPVTYLPTACLLARRSAVEDVGGFDPDLRWGEDVDLIWRLSEVGSVRYDPSAVVEHPARTTLARFVDQRMRYGSAAGPLGVRHGARLAPVRMSGWSLACWALAFAGRPGLGLAVATGTAVALQRKLDGVLPDAGVEAALLAGRGHWYAGRTLANAAARAWWPATLLVYLAGWRRGVRRIVFLALADHLLSAKGSGLGRLTDSALRIVDDGAYGVGVWRGALASRTLHPLLPKLAEWPPKDDPTT